ncbi:clavesin-1-like [Aricia agestis]|uniref:clavesin-1-like n=1 Tax=Aricia agestis TaxID=91739 RepID=UPI001C20853E|nr:clavesin-1-like [Aricia agestis]
MAVRPLIPALAERARKDFGETPDLLQAKLQEIKDWIATQPHLRARTDDQWLTAFLRGCKFKVDQAKKKIDLYYSVRSTNPEIYTMKHNDPKLKQALDLGSAIILQKLKEPAAPRPYLLRLGSYNSKEWHIYDIMTAANFQLQVCFMEDDNLSVAGLTTIIDVRNTHLSHYLQITFKTLRCLLRAYQEAMPIRIKDTHIIGSFYLFEAIMNIAKRFLSNKINKRIMVHSNMESLYKHLPKEILPAELGGTGSTLQENIDYWKHKFDDYRDFFEEDLQYATDESLREMEQKSKIQDFD